MYFGVLGPLLVRTDTGVPVAVPDTKVRILLLDLLANAGRPVSVDRLIDDLWGSRPPRNATGTLQARVSQLRSTLASAEPGARALVRHSPSGYTLDTDAVDSVSFEAHARAGRAREALGLWRGEPYVDVRDQDFARAPRQHLEDLYLAVLEHADDVLRRTTALIQQRPLDERLYAVHLKALYRAGRQQEALREYARLREALADELGADPGPELTELHQAILRHEPSLRRSPTLPTPLNPLVGRADTLAVVQEQLAKNRLVTLVGPGGVGKTRLALEVGRQIGIARLVELAPLRADDVLEALAAALDLRDEAGDLLPRLVESLQAREVLLILDNCEHLELADLVHRVLTAAPRLRVLATSRAALDVPGEQVVEVPPLTPEASAELFQARSGITEDVTAICERLDGIPLALELAATRVRALGVQGLTQRLDDRFRLLAGSKAGPERQRTLRATIDWSWDLLDDEERQMLRRLAVHAGTFSLDAAVAVSGLPEHVLLALVDKSLVVADAGRYRLLESVAAYSLERLIEAGEEARLRQQHATYYLEFAQRAELRGERQRDWLQRLDQEAANFRILPPTLELANALAWYWYLRGRYGEARRVLTAALDTTGPSSLRAWALVWLAGMSVTDAQGTDVDTALDAVGDDPYALWFLTMTRWAYGDPVVLTERIDRAITIFTDRNDRWGLAAALSTRAQLNIVHADLQAMLRDSRRSLELFDQLDDAWGRLQATYTLIVAAEISGDYPTATAYLEDAIRHAEDLGLWTEVSFRTAGLGRIALLTGDYARADELHEQARRLAIEQSNKSAEEYAEVGLGLSARWQGRLDDAERHFIKWLDRLTKIGGTPGIAFLSNQLGFIAEQRGDLGRARTLHERGFRLAQQIGDRRAIALALEGLAGATKDPRRARALLTEASTLREQVGIPLPPSERFDVDRIRARINPSRTPDRPT